MASCYDYNYFKLSLSFSHYALPSRNLTPRQQLHNFAAQKCKTPDTHTSLVWGKKLLLESSNVGLQEQQQKKEPPRQALRAEDGKIEQRTVDGGHVLVRKIKIEHETQQHGSSTGRAADCVAPGCGAKPWRGKCLTRTHGETNHSLSLKPGKQKMGKNATSLNGKFCPARAMEMQSI